MRSIPASVMRSRICSRNGFPTASSIGFGISAVSEPMREPRPAARIIPFRTAVIRKLSREALRLRLFQGVQIQQGASQIVDGLFFGPAACLASGQRREFEMDQLVHQSELEIL